MGGRCSRVVVRVWGLANRFEAFFVCCLSRERQLALERQSIYTRCIASSCSLRATLVRNSHLAALLLYSQHPMPQGRSWRALYRGALKASPSTAYRCSTAAPLTDAGRGRRLSGFPCPRGQLNREGETRCSTRARRQIPRPHGTCSRRLQRGPMHSRPTCLHACTTAPKSNNQT
jgi:hypothetical protein